MPDFTFKQELMNLFHDIPAGPTSLPAPGSPPSEAARQHRSDEDRTTMFAGELWIDLQQQMLYDLDLLGDTSLEDTTDSWED